MMRSKFAEHTPDGCPTDPGEKQDWLRAQAVTALLDGDTTTRSGTPETVVVVDTRTGTIDWGFDVTLPNTALQRFMDRSNIHIIDIHATIIMSAPGELNLGRTSRLANRAQRRVLQVLYPTCGIPGCCVKYAHTKPHHVLWWRHGGGTDLSNLLPLCSRHHARVHDGTLTLHLAPDRTLTITLRDGQTMTTGPPQPSDA